MACIAHAVRHGWIIEGRDFAQGAGAPGASTYHEDLHFKQMNMRGRGTVGAASLHALNFQPMVRLACRYFPPMECGGGGGTSTLSLMLPVIELLAASVAVSVSLPAVANLIQNTCLPLSAAVNV